MGQTTTPSGQRATPPTADVAGLRAWTMSAEDVAASLGVDPRDGLAGETADERLTEFGPNELVERAKRSPVLLLFDQFTSPMILVLLAAAVITLALDEIKDTLVIMAIVVLNGIVGFTQEYRAEQALAALARMTSPRARVVRDGQVMEVAAREIVPGDVLLLEAGDVVTADARLLDAPALRINEASLTGESVPAEKIITALPEAPSDVLSDQRNMAFSGTAVSYGRARGVVVATGMATALGRVAELLQGRGSGPTPLQRRLGSLGKRLALLALIVCGVVFISGVARGERPEEMFLVAVSLAVAAIPEGLPAVVTVSLALGARRMARRRALVRKLPAVETLGSVSVICSDKTGTLTENRMLVERLWTPGGEYGISGDGYAPEGEVLPLAGGAAAAAAGSGGAPAAAAGSARADPDLVRAARVAAACNDATLRPPSRAGEPWSITGDPTEAALLAFAGKLGVEQGDIAARCPRVAELTFDSERRRMTTLHLDEPDTWVAVKGALEAILPLLDPDEAGDIDAARGAAERYAADGYRVLALAEARLESVPEALEHAESGLHLVGVVAMADPPRPASAEAIAACRAAGISPVMITGDHPLTARAIARRLGILDGDRDALTGTELAALDEDTFAGRVARVGVYARTSPEQKLRIVDAWRSRGAVVAMTGDGVNDAPALRRADIGVAMGITGTDVSKEAADMVLADDDFATIVAAVAEGRRIYANIRRFVRYLLTTNSAEVWVMMLAPFLGLPLPLLAIQILWINLVTDGAPALALGVEPAHPHAMRQKPRRPDSSILGDGLWQHALWVGLLMAGVTLLMQWFAWQAGWAWQTMVFTALSLLQLAHAMAVRSERESTLRLGLRSNAPLLLAVTVTAFVQLALVYVPPLQPIFETVALAPVELAVVLLISPIPFVAVEMEKWLLRRRERRSSPSPA